jgi:hypothetical protein
MKPESGILLMCLLAMSNVSADTFVSDDIITSPQPDHFSVCYNNTCTTVQDLSLTQQQWQRVRELFVKHNNSPADERAIIKQAIALLEKMVGKLTGTSNDKGENAGGGADGQMDCIDESTNSTIYLLMLEQDGLLKYHHVEDRVTRGHFIFGWPHTTAVISEKRSGKRYAVDSWFLANGKPPFIVPLDKWQDGWRPAGK